jgi:phosphomevalonate kinase
MIAGEYSVLFGGKSLVAACNSYQAIAQFKASHHWAFFAHTNKSCPSNTSDKLFLATKKSAQNLGFTPKPGAYYLDTSAFYNTHSKNKLGLGSSAAGVTALCKLFLSQHDQDNRQTLLKMALDAHKNFSGKLGSGADIAAAVYESVIEFFNTPAGPHINPVELHWWPEYLWIDTRRPQNTRTFVAHVLRMARQEPAFFTEFVDQSNYFCAQLRASSSAKQSILWITNLYALLKKLSQLCKLNIISPEHRAIHELALSLGGSAKPSGAGGGDLAIAWIPPSERQNFLENIKRLGFLVLPERPLTNGLWEKLMLN